MSEGGGGGTLGRAKKSPSFRVEDLSLRKPKPNQTKNKQTNKQPNRFRSSLPFREPKSVTRRLDTEPIASRSLYVICPLDTPKVDM